MIDVKTTPEGATLKVRVTPGASREKIAGAHGDALKVLVREPPEKGRANEAVERLLATALGLRKKDVAVVQGKTARDKTVLLRGLDEAALRVRLHGLC